MLNLLVLGFAAGRSTLRRIEELSEDLSTVAKRALGIARAVSDTTLFNLLSSQDQQGLRATLVAQVRKLWRNERVRNDLFPLGVVSFDGKSVWTSTSKQIEGAKEASTESGIVVSSLAMLNAVLVSSTVRPCLDLQLIREKSGESPAFREMVRRVADSFFGMFDVITGDAGLLARENVALVRGLKKHYMFAVKGNSGHLFQRAQRAFLHSEKKSLVHTREKRSGAIIERRLFALSAKDLGDVGFYGAEELWCVMQTTLPHGGERSDELRFFITSLPKNQLTARQKLQLVRLHWGIENNRHWTLDAIFEEDDRQPCQSSRRAVEVVCWLRALAYNIVATLRAAAPVKGSVIQNWRRTIEKLRDLLVFAPAEDLTAHLA